MPLRENQDKLIMDKKVVDISSKILNVTPEDPKVIPETEEKDPNYWRSFRELYNDPDFLKEKKNEFQPGSLDRPDENSFSKFSRRKFLALLSASAAVAATGCSNFRDKGEIVPYNKKPESVTIGLPTYYASTCTGCSYACGILIKTIEGRPIKVDGNPDHPVSKGKICAIAQASVMNLYDPERLKNPLERADRNNSKETAWADADEKIINQLKSISSSGKEIAIVTHTVNSPSLKKLLTEDFRTAYPGSKVYSYELYSESARNSAFEKCYGAKLFPVVQLDKANVILALESDFLGTEGNKVENSRMYSERRDIYNGSEFNRLYAVEGNASVTGMNADYRIILRTDAIEEFVLCLLNEFILKEKLSGFTADAAVSAKLQSYDLKGFISKNNLNEEAIKHLVSDLRKNTGSSFVSAGSMLPESTHIAVNLLNEVLGNTNLYVKDVQNIEQIPLSTKAELENLISGLKSGKTGAVIHLDSNPVYHFPSEYGYADALKNAGLVISLTESVNETSEAGNFILPVNSMFESWGDFQTRSNFASLQQPVIAPLYNTRQKEDILLTWIKGSKDSYNPDLYHQYISGNWKNTFLPGAASDMQFGKEWNAALNDGAVKVRQNTAAGITETTAFKQETFANTNFRLKAGSEYVLLLTRSFTLGDGRFANNGWLQELPKPLSRIVWDNYAAVSVQTAKALGLKSNDKISVTTPAGKTELPVFIQPGTAEGVIAAELGYGRSVCGTVGKDVGVNTNKLISGNPQVSMFMYNDVKIEKVPGFYELISTQEHYAFDEPLLKDIQFRREIIQEGTYLEFKETPDFLHHRHTKYSEEETEKLKVGSINEQYDHTGTKWGMAIDLNKCTGCNECAAACNVENNIPIVGKDQVKANREMQWIRIDRYYSGTPEVPKTSFQPMLCQHCDFAPCENVCPVAATTHSADGLNAMAYNRCVGTRYCSNNCPYKVRRFNYFNFRDRFRDSVQLEESFSLMANPEVTVRSRGVMEKCTFCIQRIMEERQKAIQENRYVIGSNVKTACQEACNTNAITFGDKNDKESELYKLINSSIAYSVLEEIKVKPNISYLAKLRNVYETDKTSQEH